MISFPRGNSSSTLLREFIYDNIYIIYITILRFLNHKKKSAEKSGKKGENTIIFCENKA